MFLSQLLGEVNRGPNEGTKQGTKPNHKVALEPSAPKSNAKYKARI